MAVFHFRRGFGSRQPSAVDAHSATNSGDAKRPNPGRHRLTKESKTAAVIMMAGLVLAGTATVLGSTSAPALAATPVAKSNCAAFEPIDNGQCYDNGSGGYTWLGTITAANGHDFICIDYLKDGHLGAHTNTVGNPLVNQFGQVIADNTTNALAYAESKYAGSDGTSGGDITDAALSLIAREVMHDSGGMYPQLTVASTAHDSSYGVSATVLARAKVIWDDARSHFGGYTTTISGMPATVQPGQSYSVTVHAQSSPASGSNPMAGYVVTASLSGGTITSGNGATTDAAGNVTITFTANGTPASLTATVNNLPGLYPKIAVPSDNTQQRGLIATDLDQSAAASASAPGALNLPLVGTQTSTQTANIGDSVTDTVNVSGADAAWSGNGATANLYGPYASQPGINDCQPAQLVGSVTFDAANNGTFTTPAITISTPPGYYVWTEHFPANGNYPSIDTICGDAQETTFAFAQPKLSTQISSQSSNVGDTLSDTVKVTDTYGATITGDWSLLGPIAPAAGGSCASLTWTGAPVADQGSFTVTGDGSYTAGSFKVTKPGCYTYVEGLAGTSTTRPLPDVPAGAPSETTLAVSTPKMSTQSSSNASTAGETLTDTVKVSDTYGATVPGEWKLLGPVAPVNGACDTVDWSTAPTATTGTFTADGDGNVVTGSYVVATTGCYTYSERLAATDTTTAVPWLTPGDTAETTLSSSTPKLSTQASTNSAMVGETITDTVLVSNTHGATITGQWQLLGPVKPRHGKCAGLNWAGAKVASQGTFTVTGDGKVKVGKFKVRKAGCYTYTEALASTSTTKPVDWSTPGIHSETVLVSKTPAVPFVNVPGGVVNTAAMHTAAGHHLAIGAADWAGSGGLLALLGAARLAQLRGRRRRPGMHRG